MGRARVASLERVLRLVLDLRVAFLGSSELPSLERSGFFFARSRTSWLEREFSVSGRQATKASLEQECFISADSSVFEHHFFTLFFFQTLNPRLSLSKITPSLRFDLPRV